MKKDKVSWGKRYAAQMAEYKKDPQYIAQTYAEDLTECIYHLMMERQVSHRQLARHLNTPPAYITKMLRGNVNFNFKFIAKIACVLKADFSFTLSKNEEDDNETFTEK